MLNPELITPSEVAHSYNLDPKRVRAWLRKQGWRPDDEQGQRWFLTMEQADQVVRAFVHPRWLSDPDATSPIFSASDVTAIRAQTRRQNPANTGARDARYVLDLCDEVLGASGKREFTFEWLVGDPSQKTGRRRKLPVDSYWERHNLVVEVMEHQHYEPIPLFDKPDKLTISGVDRGEQRQLYDARRAEQIPAHGLRLVLIRTSDFQLAGNKKIDRRSEADIGIVRNLLFESDRRSDASITSP
jgi:hypothetical protein